MAFQFRVRQFGVFFAQARQNGVTAPGAMGADSETKRDHERYDCQHNQKPDRLVSLKTDDDFDESDRWHD